MILKKQILTQRETKANPNEIKNKKSGKYQKI